MVSELLHELAYIYLVLAHGTDHDLSDHEINMMVRRLNEWQPHLDEEDVRAVLLGVMNRYDETRSEEMLADAISNVRNRLPVDQRMAALNDLIKIANADGVFLDNEEDLINRLLAEWEVGAYASYAEQGPKGEL